MAILTNTEVSKTFQLGVQSDDNIAVAANKVIPDITVTAGWERTSTTYKPSSSRFPTINVNGKEWSTFTIEGPIGYASVWYFLSSGGNYAAPSGAGPYTWGNVPNIVGVDSSKAYTMEWGVAAAAFRAIGAHVVGLHFHFEYDKPTFKAEMVAKRIIPGISLTSSPAAIENVPVAGPSIYFVEGTSFSNLASSTNELKHAYVLDVDFANIYGQEWAMRRGKTSWGDRYLTDPTVTAKLTALEQVSGSDFSGTPFTLADMRAGSLNFMRVASVGPLIGTATVTGLWVVEGGQSYATAPTATFSNGTAAATITVASNVITGGSVTTPGSYTLTPPTISLAGGGGSGGEIIPIMTPTYQFWIDMALLIGDGPPVQSYLNGLKVLEWPLMVASDGTQAIGFGGVNQLSGL